jgi:dipeptidyl aminopeptidase/acylaminoacyl peptidase
MKNIIIFFTLILSNNLLAQLPNTDIWLLDIKSDNDSIYLANPKNATNRVGYDNQPAFSSDGKYFLYTSIQDEKQSDIYQYDLKTNQSTQLTKTATSEYSPQFSPDGQNISVVMVEPDSTQRLWQFPKTGGPAQLLMDKVDSVGYYCWIDNFSVSVFLLDNPNKLYRCDVGTQKCILVDDSIERSLHSVSFGKIKKLFYSKGENIYSNNSKSNIIETSKIGTGEDFCFYRSNQLFMADGAKLYSRIFVTVGKDAPWKEMFDLSSSGVKKITRLTVSPDGKKIAIVAE